eukprot:gnl/TRDRNA2_/TRDRNA2_161623_c0_seq1.p1 gnl/TRDRNA2_/TRDRNA2_161623_c0~~gnl/TRDRNA2_/TRDRNA2_161623_c0_seq1.p1  ORF type:complete len:190 (+),score=25.30 gnl/TRDRNA2_/TRDRNA2_161623_c0_seq1:26-595(+)
MRSIIAIVFLAILATSEAQHTWNFGAKQNAFLRRPQGYHRPMLPAAKANPFDFLGNMQRESRKRGGINQMVGGSVSEEDLGKMTRCPSRIQKMIPGDMAAVERTDGAWKYAQLWWIKESKLGRERKYTFTIDMDGNVEDFDPKVDGVKIVPGVLAEPPIDIVSIPAAVFIGLVMGSGLTFAAIRSYPLA